MQSFLIPPQPLPSCLNQTYNIFTTVKPNTCCNILKHDLKTLCAAILTLNMFFTPGIPHHERLKHEQALTRQS